MDAEPLTLTLPEQFNVAAYFVDRAIEEGRGDRVAVLFGDDALTYRRVQEQVNRTANALRELGVAPGDRVLILLYDSPAFVYAFWGAIRLGAIAVPLNTLPTAEDYRFVLEDSGARAIVAEAEVVEKLMTPRPQATSEPPRQAGRETILLVSGASLECASAAPKVEFPASGHEFRPSNFQVRLAGFEERLARSSPECDAAPTHRDEPAFWLYTSGSTGRPKAAIHRHRDMVCCFEAYARRVLHISPEDRTFSASKLFFAYGLGNALYFPFGAGAQTILLAGRAAPERVFDVIRRYRPTIFYGVPSLYASMLQVTEATRDDLRSLRCAVSAGEALPAPLWRRFDERFGVSILDGIGSTEMLHMFISNRPDDVVPGASGRLVPGYSARIVGEDGREVRPGEMGHLWIRGESAAAGYWNRPDLTRATFRVEWTVTGDQYRCDALGYFWYGGRSDDMLKVNGLWVSPVEIEAAIAAHPAVLECAVVGATDSDGLEKPKAFVVFRERAECQAAEDELCRFLQDRLPRYKIPQWLVAVESLPKTATGKIQRFRLRGGASAGEAVNACPANTA